MNKFLTTLLAQIRGFYETLTPIKRASVIAVAVTLAATIGLVGVLISGKNFEPLLTHVPADQLPLIVAKLQEKNIPFRVSDNGGSILIPPELLDATRMSIMAEGGTSKMGTLGFEIFDKQNFGTTTYAQRINFQRALQGELMRAINSLDPVQKSKVILALPPKKTFLEEGGKTTASVVVDLAPGKQLSEDQVRGITHLVSAAVEGLDAESVTVVDSRGKVLTRQSSSASSAMSDAIVQMKEKTERGLEERVESILAKVVGVGKVIARVTANLEGQDVTSVEEVIDPDKTAVRSIQSEEESLDGNRSNPSGIPGTRANLPGAQDNGQVGFKQNVKKELKTVNYDIPKVVKNIKEAPGKIKQLSVAVLVDGNYQAVKDKDGKETNQWTARSPEELAKYENLIKSSIGFDLARGDSVKIENIRFEQEDFGEADRLLDSLGRRQLIQNVLKYSVFGLIVLAFFFIAVRPLMRWITESFNTTVEDILPKTIEELEELQTVDNTLPGMTTALPMVEEALDPEKAETDLLRERIMGLIDSDNRKASDALSMWLIRRDS